MDQDTYNRWWPLHLRKARGGHLGADEQAFYDSVLTDLDKAEAAGLSPSAPSGESERLAELEAEYAALQARRRELAEEITRLEAALKEQTRQLLGVKG